MRRDTDDERYYERSYDDHQPEVEDDELTFLRKLEQNVQHLHRRIQEHYSGLPEVLGIKVTINDLIADLLDQRIKQRDGGE
jgi:hypothetical protein